MIRVTAAVVALALAWGNAVAAEPELGALTAKAEAGDAVAQVKLGEALALGRGVARDQAAAEEWFRKAAALMRQAAEKGSTPASYNLGLMSLKGQGMTVDRAQALVWLRKAADAKYPEAQYALGLLHVSHDAQPQDAVEAVKWLSLAATHGNAELRGKALAKIKLISDAIGADRTQEGLEAARVWFYSHS